MYTLIDYDYEKYIVPTIEKIDQIGESTYNIYYELSNTDIQYVRKIKYIATIKFQNNNFYIESNTQYTE
mgnify:CR=1 FL=1